MKLGTRPRWRPRTYVKNIVCGRSEMAQWRPLRISKNPDDDVLIYTGFPQPAVHFTNSCAVRCASPSVQRLPRCAHLFPVAPEVGGAHALAGSVAGRGLSGLYRSCWDWGALGEVHGTGPTHQHQLWSSLSLAVVTGWWRLSVQHHCSIFGGYGGYLQITTQTSTHSSICTTVHLTHTPVIVSTFCLLSLSVLSFCVPLSVILVLSDDYHELMLTASSCRYKRCWNKWFIQQVVLY